MTNHLPKEQLNLNLEIGKPLPFAISKGGFSMLMEEIIPTSILQYYIIIVKEV
jgi:hypothetical protein